MPKMAVPIAGYVAAIAVLGLAHGLRRLGRSRPRWAGAALAVAMRVAGAIDEGIVVTIFCDGGEKYLSERFWEATEATLRHGCAPISLAGSRVTRTPPL